MTDLHRILARIVALAEEEKRPLIAALAKSALIELDDLLPTKGQDHANH